MEPPMADAVPRPVQPDRPVSAPRRATRATSVLVVVLAVAAACSSTRSHAGRTTTTTARGHGSTTTSTSGSSTTTAAPTTTAAGGSTSTSASGPPACPTSQLTASLGAGQGAAGHLLVPLSLTNHGAATCVVSGYPGVSLLAGSGQLIGNPATRAARPVSPVVLAPGAAAQTTLESQNPGLSPTPCWATSTSIRIYPPGQLDALTIAGAFQVCGGEFTITPMASA